MKRLGVILAALALTTLACGFNLNLPACHRQLSIKKAACVKWAAFVFRKIRFTQTTHAPGR